MGWFDGIVKDRIKSGLFVAMFCVVGAAVFLTFVAALESPAKIRELERLTAEIDAKLARQLAWLEGFNACRQTRNDEE